MLRLEDVTAVAGPGTPGAPAKPLLRSTRFGVHPGESHLLLGANGSGKTTLIRILTGLRRPAAGRVVLDGTVVERQDGRGLWPAVAALFEEPDPQFLSDTVEGEVSFGLESLGLPPDEIRRRARESLESFDLLAFAARAPHGLSAGEKARVLLAAALAGRPRVLVLDQATTHLDPGSRRAIEERLVREALSGSLGLVRTHQDARAPYRGETLHVLDQGDLRPAAALTPSSVLALRATPFPLALRVSALLATQGRWEGPLAADADAVVKRLLAEAPGTGGGAHDRGSAAVPAPADPAEATAPAAAKAPLRPALLGLKGLSWTPPGRAPGPVLEGVDLEVAEGEVVAVLGRSGAGKSALLRLACGLVDPASGSVTRAAPAVARTRPVALAMEHPERQLFGRTALEDVAALLWVSGIDAAERRRLARRALSEVGLDPDRFGERAPLTLSEGEKRRVALAGLLVTPPLVVLLDEPTAGLDPEGRRALVASVRALRRQGRAVLLASHDLDFVGAVADRAVLLAREGGQPGRVLATKPAGALLRDEAALEQAGLHAPDFVRLASALREAGLLAGPAPRDAESLLDALARAAVGPGAPPSGAARGRS